MSNLKDLRALAQSGMLPSYYTESIVTMTLLGIPEDLQPVVMLQVLETQALAKWLLTCEDREASAQMLGHAMVYIQDLIEGR